MDTLFIPNESDFRSWIKEAVKQCLENTPLKSGQPINTPQEEPLLTRKEIAGIIRISLVTLHDWMKQGLLLHKQRGRVYFLGPEEMEYFKQKRHQDFQQDLL
jgi:hypothetical protein